MGKIRITKSELDRIIKEEALKFKKAIALKKELANVQEQLKQLNEVEDSGKSVNPVGNLKPAETQAFPGKTTQTKPKFHNPEKNPNTMMEDEADIEDTEVDIDSDVDSDTIDKAAVLSAIEDLKMALNLHGVSDESEESEEGEESEEETNGEEVGDEDAEFEFDSEDEEGENEEGEEGEEESHEDMEEDNSEDVMEENLEEPIEGGSPIQKAEEDNVNDNMKKDNHIKAAGDTLMESEKRRMAILAGIMKG